MLHRKKDWFEYVYGYNGTERKKISLLKLSAWVFKNVLEYSLNKLLTLILKLGKVLRFLLWCTPNWRQLSTLLNWHGRVAHAIQADDWDEILSQKLAFTAACISNIARNSIQLYSKKSLSTRTISKNMFCCTVQVEKNYWPDIVLLTISNIRMPKPWY